MEDRDGDAAAGVTSRPWGRLPDGREAMLFELRNGRGMTVRVCSYGGVVQSIRVPDRDGRDADVVLGFDTLDGYLADDLYVGATIGRYANRIRGGRFVLDGREHRLPVNNGPNHLHGGPIGFHRVLWDPEPSADDASVRLTHVSPDGDQGYPGRLAAEVTFRLGDGNSLEIDFAATTDAPTLVNLTHHTYFNLTGDSNRDVLGHVVAIDADRFTPVDETQIPTGELRPVAGTPFDFRAPTPLGARIDADDAQLALGRGYDHNFVLRKSGSELALAARVAEPGTGRVLELLTTEPGLQLYSGNYLVGTMGKGGRPNGFRSGLCLEPQHFPDSPNHPEFPSAVLRPGERYASRTIYRFFVDR